MDQIAVINSSSRVNNADAATMAKACNVQLAQHIAPLWKRVAVPVVFYINQAAVPAGAQVVVLLDSSDQADALGYHTEEQSKIFSRVFASPVLDNGGVVLCDHKNPQNTSIASVMSHEIAEMFCDPFVNSWVDGPRIKQGSEYALEVGDPVESDSYVIQLNPATAVAVSNFALPEFFDDQPAPGTKFDYLGKLTAPFTMTKGGYMVVRSGPGHEKQIFGDQRPAWRSATKSSPMARTFKRGLKGAPEVADADE